MNKKLALLICAGLTLTSIPSFAQQHKDQLTNRYGFPGHKERIKQSEARSREQFPNLWKVLDYPILSINTEEMNAKSKALLKINMPDEYKQTKYTSIHVGTAARTKCVISKYVMPESDGEENVEGGCVTFKLKVPASFKVSNEYVYISEEEGLARAAAPFGTVRIKFAGEKYYESPLFYVDLRKELKPVDGASMWHITFNPDYFEFAKFTGKGENTYAVNGQKYTNAKGKTFVYSVAPVLRTVGKGDNVEAYYLIPKWDAIVKDFNFAKEMFK
ncbi:hypothetical protein Dip510_002101 [Elusimicrobium posterum]|uniref:hypothetical protein n=1 Tax=Elusimicrobium posterum TaxID=3116653 RepID=UPI003C72674B